MAAIIASASHNQTDGRIREDFGSHVIYRIPGVEKLSGEELRAKCISIQHSEKTTSLDSAALSLALESAIEKSHAPAALKRVRSPTLPLDEDADGEISHGTHITRFKYIDDTAGGDNRVSTINRVATRKVQERRLKDLSVLKPVPTRISKRLVLQRRVPESEYTSIGLHEKLGGSRTIQQHELQDSNFASLTTLAVHQAHQPSNLNRQPNASEHENQPRKANLAPHLENALRATTRRTKASKSKHSTEIHMEFPTLSMAHMKRRRNPAQKAHNWKQENRHRSPPQEQKTRSGRVSNPPERFRFP